MSTNLAQQLRTGTTKSHSMAENVSFVKSFLGGVVDKKSYRKLVANLYFIYMAIEEEMEKNKDHYAVSSIYFPQLYRQSSLCKDLSYYYGSNWKKLIQPSKATKNYVNRIHEIGEAQPELLIAHAYTRYMGDLSGGQILKKIAKSAMGLSSCNGTKFYDFDDIEDESLFKKQYRNALDNVPVNNNQVSQIITEANIAFNLNMEVFQELNSNFIKIMLMLLLNTVNNFRK
uniref:heme oxygenase n=1 Tax=Hypnea edeniana TaxID=1524265 RepID=UPI0023F2C3F3|nr:heme oxygenase [Hypnea edeniana]WCH54749.1 heme oxygenase [Hypnea edeniana]WDY85141.1 heme oxygenase [Hypnea edeniana]